MISARRSCGALGIVLATIPLAVAPALSAAPAAVDEDAADAEPAAPAGDQEQPAELDAETSTRGVPDVHLVKKGDTLWDISALYFRDPWRWPKVWAQNPEITNPHWIFPGQVIRLGGAAQPGDGATAKSGPSPSLGLGGRTRALAGRGAGYATDDNRLRQTGFVTEKELRGAGVINGSREEKIMLATGDQAYVAYSQEQPPSAGQLLSVYQVDMERPIKEPGSGLVLGYLVHIYGDLRVDTLTDRPIASGTLENIVAPVERGYRVGPVVRQLKTISPRKNAVSTTARIVAAAQPNILIAQGMWVVLNRGRRHGVEVGNRFLVIRQGDGYRRAMEDWTVTDVRFPPDEVAELLAVDVQDETTVAWVAGGNRELRIGDVADLKKGY